MLDLIKPLLSIWIERNQVKEKKEFNRSFFYVKYALKADKGLIGYSLLFNNLESYTILVFLRYAICMG